MKAVVKGPKRNSDDLPIGTIVSILHFYENDRAVVSYNDGHLTSISIHNLRLFESISI
jgi:hypothetical protein